MIGALPFFPPLCLLLLVLLSPAFAARGEPTSTLRQPNLLLIVADDLGYADVGFNGGQVIRTPQLDRLAASGVVLGDFRTCPMCSPTRAGLLTGRWPLRFGLMRAVIPPWSRFALDPAEQTLPEYLAGAGYAHRAIIGKWHLGHARREDLPSAHGFTYFYGHYNGAVDYFTHAREGEVDWHENERTVREEGYATDLLAAAAVRFLETAPADAPWLLYLPFNAPHTPLQARPEDLARYPGLEGDARVYAAMVDALDQAVGRVLAALAARHDNADTLVLFCSDNGGIPRVGSSNAPWRGEKLSVYEGGTRVAAALRWPAAGLAGGRRFDGRIGYIDVLPTVLAAAGLTVPPHLDGIDVLPALRGTKPLPDRPWFSYIHQSAEALASVHLGTWKLVARGDFFAESPGVPPQLELYDLARDPTESHDLASKHPERTADLHRRLREFGTWQRPGIDAYNAGRAGFVAPRDWIVGGTAPATPPTRRPEPKKKKPRSSPQP